MEFIESFKRQLAATSKNISSVSLKNYLSDIRHFINWFEKVTRTDFSPENITAEIIELYKSSQGAVIVDGNIVRQEKLSPSSMKRHLSSLRKFVSVMQAENIINENPFESMSSEKVEKNYDYWHLDTFKDYLLENTASKLTIKNYLADIRGFANWYEQAILPSLENPLTSTDGFYLISQGIIEEYKKRLNTIQSSAPRTINRKLSSLRKYLEFAAKKGFIGVHEISIPSVSITKEEVQPVVVTLSDIKKSEKESAPDYSHFPPLRLMQKLLIFPYLALEELAAAKIATFMAGQKMVTGMAISQIDKARLATKSIVKAQTMTIDSLLGVRNLKKEFYAPHAVQLSGLPLHKKLLHHIRYTRPQWYKTYHTYPFVHYAHFALLVIFAVGVGVAAYQSLVGSNQKPTFAAATAPPRILSFQGRLTDVNDNPITSATDIRFGIYNDITASGAALLWQEVHYTVFPDQDGIFSVLLGTNTAIPSTVFSDNAGTYLGVTINSTSELTPRQRIASVAYATNSEQLQGMQPITAIGAGTSNVVLALDSSGNLTIGGSANPTFTASGGQFKLSGQPLLLTTNSGSNGNIVISPDGLGKIDVQKPLINTGASGNIAPGGVEVNDKFGVLATESGIAAFTVNNDGSSDIFTASSGGTTRFTIATTGVLTIPTYNTNGGIFYANGSGTLSQTTAGSLGQCLQSVGGGTPTWSSCGGSGSNWRLINGALSPINDTLDLLIGNSATASAKFGFLNVGNGTPTASISANSGNNSTTLSGNGFLGTTNKMTLSIGNGSTGNVIVNSQTDSNTSIGTSSTLGTLKIAGNSPGKALVNLQYLGAGQNILVASNSAGVNVFTIEEDGDVVIGNGGGGKLTAAIIDPYLIQNQYTSVTPELIFQTMAASNGDFIYKNQSTELARLVQAGQFQLPITGSTGGLTIGGDTQLFRGASDRLDLASGDSFNVISGNIQIGGTTVIDSSRNGTFNTLTVSGGCTGCVSVSDSPFKTLSGAIMPHNSTLDFLIGGQATTSAKFGVLNINTGTPTASISANSGNIAAYLTGDGTLATTNRQTLIIGNSSTYNTTGNVLINPNGTGDVGIGTTTATAKLDVNGTASISGALKLYGTPTIQSTVNQTLTLGGDTTGNISFMPRNGSGYVGIGTNSPLAPLHISQANGAGDVGLIIQNNATTTNETATLRFRTTTSTTVDFATIATVRIDVSTGRLDLSSYKNGLVRAASIENGNVSIGTTTPSSTLFVTRPLSVGANGKALAIFDQIENQDILAASSSGITKLKLSNAGVLSLVGGQTSDIDTLTNTTLNIGATNATTISLGRSGQGITLPGFTGQNGVLYGTSGTGVLEQATTGSSNQCLLSGASNPAWGTCPGAGAGGSNWTLDTANGLLRPNNNTVDILFGGTASNSAKFAFLNVAGGTPTASISANTASNNTFLTGLGNLGTTNAQTLTIGGSTTGNIVLDSGSSAISLLDDTTISANLSVSGTTGLTLSGAGSGISFTGSGLHEIGASSGTLRIGAHTLTGTITGGNQNISSIGNISANSSSNTITGFGTIGTTGTTAFNGTSLNFTGGQTSSISGNLIVMPNVGAGGRVGIGIDNSAEHLALAGGNFVHTALGNPTTKGTYDTTGTATEVFIAGKYAYVADGGSGLQIIDISNPVSPQLVGTYDTPDQANGIYVSGKYAYVTDSSALLVIDVSNPLAPQLVGTQATSNPVTGVYVSGQYAYVSGNSGLLVFDVSDPTSPQQIAILGAGGASAVYVSGKYAYVASGGSGLQIIDISNPISPQIISTYDTSSSVQDVYVSGKYAYIADNANGVEILNIANPAIPQSVGTYVTAGTTNAIYVSGKYAYTAGNSGGLVVLDISSPSSPQLIGSFSGSATDVYIAGKYAYFAASSAGLKIFDINGIETPSLYAGNARIDDLTVSENGNIANNLYVGNGLNLGMGGLLSNGTFSFVTASGAGNLIQGAPTGRALLTINQTGSQDIFTASSSGIAKFSITNAGGIKLGASEGNLNQCLLSGGAGAAASWGTCGSGSGGSNWTINNNGTIYPINNTLDLLLGGTASTSAKFAFLNVAGGTPTASISANSGDIAIYIAGDGSLATTNRQSLTLGNSSTYNTTGNILLNPNGVGLVGIGTTSPISQLHVTKPLSGGATGKALAIFDQMENQDLFTASSSSVTKFVIGNDGRVGINTALSPTGVSPTAMFQLFSTLGTSPAASISGTTATPLLQLDQMGSGDIFTASKSGVTQFKIANNGDVDVGPNATGKLNAGTVDPPYTIDGEGYATYVPSMIGVKEEYAGKAVLSYNAQMGAYAYKLDFNKFEKQSDQWVYNRIIDPDISKLTILMSANSAAKTWYKKDGANRTITLLADRPVEISYRLTAPRFDHQNWKTYTGVPKGHIAPPPTTNGSGSNDNNIAIDPYFASLSINEENGQYVLKDSNHNNINQIDAFSKAIVASIDSGLVKAKKITADTLSSGEANISNLTASSLSISTETLTIGGQNIKDFILATVRGAGFSENNQIISPVAQIDQIKTNVISPLAEEGSVALHVNPHDFEIKNTQTGQSLAKFDNAGNATFSGTLESEVGLFDEASVSGTLVAGNLNANEASIAGTLRADRIIANNVDLSDEAITKLSNKLNTNNTSSGSGTISNGNNLAIGNLTAQYGIFEQGIVSFGPATFGQISALDSISIGQGFILGNNSINTLGADLEIQPLRQGNVSFMAGRVTIDTDGNMAVDGDLNITGKIAATNGIFTNSIQSKSLITGIISPLADSDLVVKFATGSGKVQIQDSSGNELLAINNQGDLSSSGSAKFSKFNLSLVGKAEAINENEAIATGSAGFATLKRGKPEITIINPNITKDSLIYITPFGNTNNKVLYLLRQAPNDPVNGTQGSFTVGVSGTPTTTDLEFNWLIVN